MAPAPSAEEVAQAVEAVTAAPAPGVELVAESVVAERAAAGEGVVDKREVATFMLHRSKLAQAKLRDAVIRYPGAKVLAAALAPSPRRAVVVAGVKRLTLSDRNRDDLLQVAIEASETGAPPVRAVRPGNPTDGAPPAGYPASAHEEVGYGVLSTDHSSQPPGACAEFSRNGLFSRFNWPLKYALTSVKDQGNRGTCGAFAVASAAEMSVALAQRQWVNLSEQDLYFHTKGPWVGALDESDGMSLPLALPMMIATRYAFAYESQWDYNKSHERLEDPLRRSCDGYSHELCRDTYHQGVERCSVLSFWNCLLPTGVAIPSRSTVRLNTMKVLGVPVLGFAMDAIKEAIADKKPVVISLEITRALQVPDADGFLHHIDDQETDGGHIMHAVGYLSNDEVRAVLPQAPLGAGGGYFIVKNSWGDCYGDRGYVYMPVEHLRRYGTGAIELGF